MAASLIIAALALGGAAVAVDRRASAREAQAPAAYPPEGRLITVDGRQVHAVTRGTGPDLILIHGASGNTRDFTVALADRLAREFRVTAFDRPGLGWSEDAGAAGIDPRAYPALIDLVDRALRAHQRREPPWL